MEKDCDESAYDDDPAPSIDSNFTYTGGTMRKIKPKRTAYGDQAPKATTHTAPSFSSLNESSRIQRLLRCFAELDISVVSNMPGDALVRRLMENYHLTEEEALTAIREKKNEMNPQGKRYVLPFLPSLPLLLGVNQLIFVLLLLCRNGTAQFYDGGNLDNGKRSDFGSMGRRSSRDLFPLSSSLYSFPQPPLIANSSLSASGMSLGSLSSSSTLPPPSASASPLASLSATPTGTFNFNPSKEMEDLLIDPISFDLMKKPGK